MRHDQVELAVPVKIADGKRVGIPTGPRLQLVGERAVAFAEQYARCAIDLRYCDIQTAIIIEVGDRH